ncbi:unnamed protein product, partial [Vitis vinifera]
MSSGHPLLKLPSSQENSPFPFSEAALQPREFLKKPIFLCHSQSSQDQSLKKTIGAGRLNGGLFVVKPFPNTPRCSQDTSSSNPTLWYQCLGHLCFSHFKLFSKYISSLNPLLKLEYVKFALLLNKPIFISL